MVLGLLLVSSGLAWQPGGLPASRLIQPPLHTPIVAAVAAVGETEASPPSVPAATKPPILSSLLKMARLNSVPMAAGLVVSGAYGARRVIPAPGLSFGACVQLALCTVLTIIVTSGSMLINDYHDFVRGVDTIETKPNRPLPRGDIPPHMVKRALKWMYAAHLGLICLVEIAPVRLWVLGSTMLTYLYSQHLKPRTGLKNAVCALIVAMAIGLGGMCVGGFPAGLTAVWPSMVVMGCGIFHRELMMDIKDLAGDAMTGVPTLPVMLGRNGAWLVSLLPLLVASTTGVVGASSGAVAFASTLPICAMMFLSLRCRAGGFRPEALGLAIESAPAWLAFSIISLMRAA